MITLKIKKPVFPNKRVTQVLKAALAQESITVETDEILLLKLQIAVLKGELDPTQLRIVFPEDDNGYSAEATMNDKAVASCWPPEVFRENMPLYMEIVELRRARHQAEEQAKKDAIKAKILP